MSKSLVEMTVEIVTAQAGVTTLSPEDIADRLREVFQALKAAQQSETGGTHAQAPSEAPQASIQHNHVICLECGQAFQLLSNRHLALHNLTTRAYKQKHGIRLTQALSARTLSAKRRKLAKKLEMGKRLTEWRDDRQRQT
jgi:predicted transcriptional regulator